MPALDCAYKLQEYAGTPKRKLSEGKATWPGRKQVWRAYDLHGRMRGDILSLETDKQPGETLIVPVMRGGKRLRRRRRSRKSANAPRASSRACPSALERLEPSDYPVTVAQPLRAMAAEIDARARVSAALSPRKRIRRRRRIALRACARHAAVPALFQPRAPSP